MWESIRFCQMAHSIQKELKYSLKCHIKNKNKLNIDFLFHLVQYFKTFHLTYIHTKLIAF